MKIIKVQDIRINIENVNYIEIKNFPRQITEEITRDVYSVDFYFNDQKKVSAEFNMPEFRDAFLAELDTELETRNF